MSATQLSAAAPESRAVGAVSDRPAQAAQRRPPGAPNAHPLRSLLWQFRHEALWVVIFGMFSNLLLLTPTLYMMQVFDRVFLSSSEYTLAALSALALVFFLAMGFSDWARSRLLVRAGTRFDELAQTDVFRASFDAQLRSTRGQANQPLADLTQLRQFITGNGVFALIDTPWAVIYTAALYLIHPWLGWLAAGFVALTLLLAVITTQWVKPWHASAQTATVENNQYLSGKLRNAETVEALGMLKDLRRHWLTLNDKVDRTSLQAGERAQRVQSVVKFLQYAQGSLVLALGALLAIDGQISAGAMLACNALLTNALRPIGTLVQSWKSFLETRTAYERLTELLVNNPPDGPSERDADQIKGQVSLRGLVAKAERRPEPILKGLDAEFRAGEVVAIVGPSGAGKSTLARCLVGIWPDTQHQVLLDGVPLSEWPRDSLGSRLGYLPQDIELFEGTIAENIGRFRPDVSADVIDAAKRCGIHDMVLRMPKGYDTPMGEAGSSLSGGQRQRIGLARAILGNPKVVVLDEPNANLDDAGESALLRAVFDLKSRGTTVFMIVHQKHLLAVADRLLVLDNGRIGQLATIQHGNPVTSPVPSV
jgi:ATP-binding cassette subfamily C exporter for protease/lipase